MMIRRHTLMVCALLPALTLGCHGGEGEETVTPTAQPRCDLILQPVEVIVDSTFDADGDGFVDAQNLECQGAYDPALLDCDDSDPAIHPNAAEIVCNGVDEDCNPETRDQADVDQDGISVCQSCDDGNCQDCDDDNDAVGPGFEEICDGLDNDCNDLVDDGVQLTVYPDADGDGYGVDDEGEKACSVLDGYAQVAGDCDDLEAGINPGATEICSPWDEDCDGLNDDDDDSVDPQSYQSYYQDSDGDGYGQDDSEIRQCTAPDDYVSEAGDCQDDDALIHPGQEEVAYNGVDDDCDAQSPDDDLDGDGFGLAEDCNDELDGVNPGADEIPYNGLDDDCDGQSPDDDLDGDGFLAADDCDDGNASVYPGADEIPYTGVDEDCDAATPDDDLDGDGFEVAVDCADDDAQIHPEADEVPYNGVDEDCSAETPDDDLDGDGFALAEDCNDENGAIHPEASEICDGIDNDCDTRVDGADDQLTGGQIYYADADLDGYGDPNTSKADCALPQGLVENAEDCDDSRPEINPQTQWYVDGDADGYGDAEGAALTQCEMPEGYALAVGDCDDTNPAYNPGVEETDCADPEDYNCDGSVGFADEDGDGFAACLECDDLDPQIHPEAEELCDGLDNDCDEKIDDADDDVVEPNTFYADADGDGYGDAQNPRFACLVPEGAVQNSEDCDDGLDQVHPGVDEVPYDGIDNDCDPNSVDDDLDGDGYILAEDCNDEDALISPDADEVVYDGVDNDCDAQTLDDDLDGDGFIRAEECDDADETRHPGAEEICDEVDQDCDEESDEGALLTFYIDADDDDFGDPENTILACEAPAETVENGQDCDDDNADIYPGQVEDFGDERDNDCDKAIDERMILIPEGRFVMGSDADDPESLVGEGPEHIVELAAFFMELDEITHHQYAAYLNAVGSNTSAEGKQRLDLDDSDVRIYLDASSGDYRVTPGFEQRPVVEVTWYGARDYCAFYGKSLPSEAQWEYGARGDCRQDCDVSDDGSDSSLDEPIYPWGNATPTCELANYVADFGPCSDTTLDAGALPDGDSPFGLGAMAGNVREWTADCLHENYVGAPTDGSPWLEGCVINFRLLRGGSFLTEVDEIRAASRYDSPPSTADNDIGFRCMRTITDEVR